LRQRLDAHGTTAFRHSAKFRELGAGFASWTELVADGAWLRVGLSDAHRVGICSVEIEPIALSLTAGYWEAWGYSNGAG
jgi:hypothetical protein